ncbi:MAG: glycosyltransferase family 2 protein [Candidatus Coatesbacteria bacterium]
MSQRPAVSILIPVFNEAPRLPALFRALGRLRLPAEVVAVDDGSADGSGALLRRWAARDRRHRVLAHPRNRGKGAAIRTALRSARGRTVVLLDADLECDPGDIPKLLAVLARHPNAAVFGTRFPHGFGVPLSARVATTRGGSPKRESPQPPPVSSPAGTRLANRLLTGTVNMLYGTRLTDMACGYKALPAARLRALRLTATRFELEAELTAGLLHQGIHIIEAPIRYRPRSYLEGKKIHPLDGLRILWRLLLLRIRIRHPISRTRPVVR